VRGKLLYLVNVNILLLPRAKHVYGYEVVPEAIADAQKNAKLNDISNATFVQGDLNKISETFGKEFPKPDIIISGLSCFVLPNHHKNCGTEGADGYLPLLFIT
jgi:tRNA G37 N-methylase Trm5